MTNLIITAYKMKNGVGRYYDSRVIKLEDFPNAPTYLISPKKLANYRIDYAIKLWEAIANGDRNDLSPVYCGFHDYLFTFMIDYSDSKTGFLSYVLDRSEKEKLWPL